MEDRVPGPRPTAARVADHRRRAAFVVMAVLLSGCATTRIAQFGMLADNQHLLTVVVTEDLDVVKRECRNVPATGQILGCEIPQLISLPDGVQLLAIKIVRYTDALPSAMAFEIETHEVCHAIAAIQRIGDPCHNGNGGVLQSRMPSR